jgi:hypothetical protein
MVNVYVYKDASLDGRISRNDGSLEPLAPTKIEGEDRLYGMPCGQRLVPAEARQRCGGAARPNLGVRRR